jgi:hypothetical protein
MVENARSALIVLLISLGVAVTFAAPAGAGTHPAAASVPFERLRSLVRKPR